MDTREGRYRYNAHTRHVDSFDFEGSQTIVELFAEAIRLFKCHVRYGFDFKTKTPTGAACSIEEWQTPPPPYNKGNFQESLNHKEANLLVAVPFATSAQLTVGTHEIQAFVVACVLGGPAGVMAGGNEGLVPATGLLNRCDSKSKVRIQATACCAWIRSALCWRI
eukprot:4665030-Amphidinium_carterae.1